jgi:DNA-binding NtrC family response regulator
VGGKDLQRSDIRLVAATHRDLAQAVAEGRFRQDLYYRLRVIVIHTPALRERKEDIPVLAETFVAQENTRHGLAVRGISRSALELLQQHSWPGNVRELRNVISAAVVMKQRGFLEREDLLLEPPAGRERTIGSPYLPVPIGPRPDDGIDLGVLASALLELQRDIKEIKSLLRAGGPGGQMPLAADVVETIAGEADYSPLGDEEGGDLQVAERALIEAALRATGGHRRRAAERLGISERTLYRKIKEYGLQ